MNHIVYFLGGPMDLTKRAFPGEVPAARFFMAPVFKQEAKFYGPNDRVPTDEEGRIIREDFEVAKYEMLHVKGRAWVAVHVE